MHVYENPVAATHEHMPWNKGKLTGAKPPFRPKHVWSIRTKLQLEGRIRAWQCSTWQSTASSAAAMSSH